MPDAPTRRSNFLQFALLFAIILIGTQMLLPLLFPAQFGAERDLKGVLLRPANAKFSIGHHPVLVLDNRTEATIQLPNRCPEPPVDLFMVQNPGTPQEQRSPITSAEAATGCAPIDPIAPGEDVQISLAPWKYSLFERVGTFEAALPASVVPTGSGAAAAISSTSVSSSSSSGSATAVQAAAPVAARFVIVEPGAATKLFRTFITAPFLNFLIFVASILPNHSLGIAIIILTLLVKLLLFYPTKHALEGQKKMQLLQPKLDALKHQYGKDAQKLQAETMKLWKEHKINPFSSCLPTLLQFPILIGLFYVVRDGSHLELSRHLIYPLYQNLPWTFDTVFLGFDLLKPSLYILPPLLVLMQFFQMRLAFKINQNKRKNKEAIIDVGADGKPEKKKDSSPQQVQQQVMMYALPLMIGFFAIKFPSAVSLYWGVSTLFAIGQQILVNREHLTVRS